MKRSQAWLGAALWLVCAGVFAADSGKAGSTSDAAHIYAVFLHTWAGDSHHPLNVSKTAGPPTAGDIQQYSDCAKASGIKHAQWSTSAPVADLRNSLGELANVRFVDPKTWHPRDPGDFIAKGKPVDSSVDEGIANGLMTLSAITFNARHDTAMLTYSFRCGALCGNGGVVMFNKTSKGWTQNSFRCSGWMS